MTRFAKINNSVPVILFTILISCLLINPSLGQNKDSIYTAILVEQSPFTELQSELSFTFHEMGIVSINHQTATHTLIGTFAFEVVALEKSILIDGESGTFDNLILHINVEELTYRLLLREQDCKVIDDTAMLPFENIEKSLIETLEEAKEKGKWNEENHFILYAKIKAKKPDLSELITGSRFLKSIDFTYRTWFAFIIEEAFDKPNQEEALDYALSKILHFPDEQRKHYGELLKNVIIEKYRNK